MNERIISWERKFAGVIAQLLDAGESECSVIMLWTYIVASFSLTIWATVFMWLLQL